MAKTEKTFTIKEVTEKYNITEKELKHICKSFFIYSENIKPSFLKELVKVNITPTHKDWLGNQNGRSWLRTDELGNLKEFSTSYNSEVWLTKREIEIIKRDRITLPVKERELKFQSGVSNIVSSKTVPSYVVQEILPFEKLEIPKITK